MFKLQDDLGERFFGHDVSDEWRCRAIDDFGIDEVCWVVANETQTELDLSLVIFVDEAGVKGETTSTPRTAAKLETSAYSHRMIAFPVDSGR